MTPQEFQEQYQESQERLGNRLQALTDLNDEIQSLLTQLNQDYDSLNQVVETFLREQSQNTPPVEGTRDEG